MTRRDEVSAAPLVSVVTPVYNESEHIAECIESILNQSYQNWEYIILDNCSTDNTAEIAERYADVDSRIRVIRCDEFLPQVENHNRALRCISKDSVYCKVVFGDDWIFPECLERMVALAEANPSVGIVGAYTLEGDEVRCTGLPYQVTVFTGSEICKRHVFQDLFVLGTPSSILYRASLIRGHDQFYEPPDDYSDLTASYKLLSQHDFGFVHQVLTYTRIRPGSMFTFANALQSKYACLLYIITKYGRTFLGERDAKAALERLLSKYYRVLGREAFRRFDRGFWEYHKIKLNASGVGFSYVRLAKATFMVFIDAVLNPKRTAERLLRRHMASCSEKERACERVEPGESEFGRTGEFFWGAEVSVFGEAKDTACDVRK